MSKVIVLMGVNDRLVKLGYSVLVLDSISYYLILNSSYILVSPISTDQGDKYIFLNAHSLLVKLGYTVIK